MQNYIMLGLGVLAAGIAVYLCIRFFRRPIGFLVHTALKAFWGTALLMAFNTLGQGGGVFLAVNPVTIGVCGVLGVPGVLALGFIRLWF